MRTVNGYVFLKTLKYAFNSQSGAPTKILHWPYSGYLDHWLQGFFGPQHISHSGLVTSVVCVVLRVLCCEERKRHTEILFQYMT